MKIALGKTYFAGPVSGADETVVAYAIALHQAGHDVRLVLLHRCAEDDQYYVRLKNAGVPVSFVVTRSLLYEALRLARDVLASTLFFIFLVPQSREFLRPIWRALMRLVTRPHFRDCCDVLNAARPDVLHVFTPDSGAALMIRAGHQLGIPVLYHEMGTAHHLPMLAEYYRRMEQVLPLCTAVAALSPGLAAEWSRRFPFLPSISVLPLIVERSKTFSLVSDSPADDEDEIVFGFAARLDEAKGPLMLVEALAKIKREMPTTIARIAGVGPQLLQAKTRTRELGLGHACEFVGHYSEPLGRAAFMSSLDVFVLPSLAEGTPNGIVEAMAHGVPIIASEVGGIRDIVGEDAGILVPAGDTFALAEAMLKLAKDAQLRKKMGAAALERYQKLFTAKAVMPLLLDVYQRAIGNGHLTATSVTGNGNLHPWARSKPADGPEHASVVAAGSLVDRQAPM